MKNRFASFAASSAMILLGGSSLTACSVTNKSLPSSTVAAGLQAPESFVGTAGVKNVNQLLLSMTTVTNINPSTLTNSSIANQYKIISPFLSADGSVGSINSAMLLAITGLAGQVCQVFVAAEAVTPNVLAQTTVTFSGPNWSTQFTSSPTVSTNVINALSNQFWGRLPTSDEMTALMNALQGSVTTIPTTDTGTQAVQDILMVPCTIMLASPAFLLG